MTMESTHQDLAEALRRRVADAGVVDPLVRIGAMHAGGGEHVELEAPYAELVGTIAEASYRVTDAQVRAVREAAGSDKAAFEVVMSACIGAGLRRWDAVAQAIQEAADATG